MSETTSFVLALNRGSSSIKCALFTFELVPRQIWTESVSGIGPSAATLSVLGHGRPDRVALVADGTTHATAVDRILAAIDAPMLGGVSPASCIAWCTGGSASIARNG